MNDKVYAHKIIGVESYRPGYQIYCHRHDILKPENKNYAYHRNQIIADVLNNIFRIFPYMG